MRSWELQQAVKSRLAAWPALVDLEAAVNDHLPQDVGYPNVVVGEDLATPLNVDDELDTDHVVTLHQWSRYRGQKEVKQMQQACYSALHRNPITVDGATYVDCHIQSEENFLDDDGLTRHGVQRFIFLIDEVTP